MSISQKKGFFNFFPTPEYLLLSASGLAITDESIRLIGFSRPMFGHKRKLSYSKKVDLPEGVIQSGFINDAEKFKEILKDISKGSGGHYVHATLPEERAYLFTATIEKVPEESLRDAVAFILEENAPLSLAKAVFDFEVIGETEDHKLKVVVSVLSKKVVDFYIEVLESAGLTPVSFDIESQAIARACISRGDKSTQLIINLGRRRTGLYIVEDEIVQFTTSLSYGVSEGDNTQHLKDLKTEISKIFDFWGTRSSGRKVEKILLTGIRAKEEAFIQELLKDSTVKFSSANAWVNTSLDEGSLPQEVLEESLSYAPAIGAELSDFNQHAYKLLTEEERVRVSNSYQRRRWVVGLSSLALALVVGVVGSVPAYLLSYARKQEMAERTKVTVVTEESEESALLSAWLTDFNLKLGILSPVLDKDRPSQMIGSLLEETPEGIQITDMVWSKVGTEGLTSLSVSGVARDRQILLSFDKKLKDSRKFSGVNLPLSSLAKDKDLTFQLKLVSQKIQ